MPAMKRPAAAQATKSAKVIEPANKAVKVSKVTRLVEPKKAIVDPFIERCNIVSEALCSGDVGGPAEMLVSMLPFAAAPPPRHHFQEGTLKFIEKELQAQEATFKSGISRLHATVLGADAERNKRAAAVSVAEADAFAKAESHSAAKVAEAATKQETKRAREATAAARAAQKDGDADLDKAEENQRILTTALEEKGPLEGAETPVEELGPRAKKLCASLALVVRDVGLLSAAEKAFSKPTEQRAVFDKMVLSQLSEEMAKSLKAVQQAIAEGMPAKAARAQAVQACESAQQAAAERQCEAEMAESNANVARQDAVSALKAAKESLADHASEVEAAAGDVSQAEVRLAEFQAGALQAFADLRDPAALEAKEAAAKAAADAELDTQVAKLNAEAAASEAAAAAADAAAARAAAAEAEAAATEVTSAEVAAAEGAPAEPTQVAPAAAVLCA